MKNATLQTILAMPLLRPLDNLWLAGKLEESVLNSLYCMMMNVPSIYMHFINYRGVFCLSLNH